jgi:predicted ATPase
MKMSMVDNVWRKELARLIPELSAEQPDLKLEPVYDPWQRLRLFEALARATLSEHKKPLLLLFDDLQWCDQDTLEWLRFLLHFDTEARLLVLGVVRPEELDRAHPLHSLLLDLHLQEQLIEIELGPLDANDTAALAEQASPSMRCIRALRQRVSQRITVRSWLPSSACLRRSRRVHRPKARQPRFQ